MSAAEKHVILCSQANSVGPAACMNIERALKDPALFFFGELLGTFCHSHFPHCQHFLVGDGVFCGGGLTDSSLLHLFGTPFLPQPFPTPPLDRQLFPPPSSTVTLFFFLRPRPQHLLLPQQRSPKSNHWPTTAPTKNIFCCSNCLPMARTPITNKTCPNFLLPCTPPSLKN